MAVSQFDFSLALVLGFAPALAIMYWSIRPFDIPFTQYRLFDDRRMFGGLAVGIIFGAVASLVEVNVPSGLYGTVLALVAFFVFEESFKLIWLNRKSYRGRFDTTFYGVSIGAGVGGSLAVANLVGAFPSLYEPDIMATFVLLSASLGLVHVDSGVLIGFGASRGEMMYPFLRALAVRGVHAALLLAVLVGAPQPWSLIAVATSIVFASVIYHYAYTVLLPATVPDDIRREMKREKRRERRAKA